MLSDGRVVPGLEIRYEGGPFLAPATCDEAAAALRWRWFCRATLAGPVLALADETDWPTDGPAVDPDEAREAARTAATVVARSLTPDRERGASPAAVPSGFRSESGRRVTLAVARPGLGRVWLVGLGAAGRP